jgi:uncharacterized membrane protein
MQTMDPFSLFVLFHSLLSIVALIAGIVPMYHLVAGGENRRWARIFIIAAVATSVTGFMFPFHQFLPSHAVGILSLLALATVIIADYRGHGSGLWSVLYRLGLIAAEFFLVFVAIAQAFEKIPPLRMLAPTGKEPVFFVVESLALVGFAILAVAALRASRRTPVLGRMS